MTGPAPARAVAAHVLERVERDAAFADVALEVELARRRLDPRDAGLATELVYGVLRWQRYLDWMLAPHSRRPLDGLDTRVRVALRLAAYQLVFLERVPRFAAVSEAVALARGRPGAAAFTNAVLRAFTRRGGRAHEPALPPDAVDALAIRCSFPTWLTARWVARHGAAEAEALMRALNERPALGLRANTLRTDRDALAARLAREDGVATRPARWAPEGLVAERAGTPGGWGAFIEGECVVQDEASMLVARLVDPAPGELVADVCAAPGTKTTHLAQLMGDRGRILAFDPQPGRLARVAEVARRLGVSIVETLDGSAEALAPQWRAACDAVLVDAPCSNLGVLRRNPEVKWRRRPEDIGGAAARQAGILDAAATMVRPGGRLVYATCSLEPEENDEVARDFLADHAGFTLAPPPSFPVALDAGGFLRCRPHVHGTDGFTAVRFRRRWER